MSGDTGIDHAKFFRWCEIDKAGVRMVEFVSLGATTKRSRLDERSTKTVAVSTKANAVHASIAEIPGTFNHDING